jgi:hypothetical protein
MGIEAISSSTAALDRAAMQAQTQATRAGTPAAKADPSAAPKAGGRPPVKGGGGAKPAESGASASGTASAAKVYDPADTNQDGVVSYAEALLYSIKHPTADTTQNQKAVTASQLQNGLNAYQQGQQANSTTESSLLFAA